MGEYGPDEGGQLLGSRQARGLRDVLEEITNHGPAGQQFTKPFGVDLFSLDFGGSRPPSQQESREEYSTEGAW